MRKKLLLASLLVSFYSIVFAQENSHENTYKHDVGFNTTFLFDGILNSDAGPFSVMYKINQSEKKAVRLGLSTSISSSNKHDKITNSSYSDYTNASIFFTIGKEFRRQINKWVWYGGGDILPHYYLDNTSNYTNGSKYNTTKSNTLGLSLRPFLGIRYNINSRLYMAAEAGINFNFDHSRYYNKNDFNNTLINDYTNTTTGISTGSATGIYLFYRF